MKLTITSEDCRSCGACCVANGDGGDVLTYGYADLTPEDVAQMSPHVRRQLHEFFIGGETRYATRAKQLASGDVGCQFLRGTPGRRCSCSIYERRPEVCQKFRVGGAMCRAARMVLDARRQEEAT
ncbi:MAG TPA: YkgJ family cysteine cluster protein [Gaiellaceae bacterium]|nr:YkgJ family cysteine cluster protein [Gaiellaceae bacterium]